MLKVILVTRATVLDSALATYSLAPLLPCLICLICLPTVLCNRNATFLCVYNSFVHKFIEHFTKGGTVIFLYASIIL